jgi:hypothetical protein
VHLYLNEYLESGPDAGVEKKLPGFEKITPSLNGVMDF